MIFEIASPTFVAEGTTIQGDLVFSSSAHLLGTVEGNVEHRSPELLHLGKSSWVQGNIVAVGPVRIEGKVTGNVTSAARIQVRPSARINGALHSPTVEIQAGAIINGEIGARGASLRPLPLAA